MSWDVIEMVVAQNCKCAKGSGLYPSMCENCLKEMTLFFNEIMCGTVMKTAQALEANRPHSAPAPWLHSFPLNIPFPHLSKGRRYSSFLCPSQDRTPSSPLTQVLAHGWGLK
jgi:hypothetical protein